MKGARRGLQWSGLRPSRRATRRLSLLVPRRQRTEKVPWEGVHPHNLEHTQEVSLSSGTSRLNGRKLKIVLTEKHLYVLKEFFEKFAR